MALVNLFLRLDLVGFELAQLKSRFGDAAL